MKQFLTLILAILCSTSIALATEYSGTIDDISWTLDTETGLLTISGSGYMYGYSSYEDYPWYEYRSYITSIFIEYGVVWIGDYAFYGCYNLTSVTFGELETDFYTNLTGGEESQKKWVPCDGDYGIGQCTGPMMYCNPDDVLNDGTYETDLAFENWAPNWDPGFQSWLIAETDPYMDSYMIFSLYSATGCTLEEYRGEDGEKGSSTGTTLSGKYTFNIDDEEHPTLSFTDTYSMHCLSFDDVCDNYTSEIKVIELTEYILQLATMRTNDEGSWWIIWNFIPEDLALGFIEVPTPLWYIGDYAFYGCSSLTSITLPEDISIIGESAFGSCTSLTSITSLNETPPYINNSTFSGRYSLATLYAASTDYATADYWENFTNIVYDTSGNAISSVSASTSAIRAIGNAIVITTETSQTVQVYSLAGQLIVKQAVSAGETSIDMPTGGVYVVALADGTKAKVLVK